jgi:DNA polymerase-3 subunit alpha
MFEAVAFSEALAQGGHLLEPGASVIVSVSTRWDGDDLKLQILSVMSLKDAAASTGAGLRIFLDDPKPLPSIAERLKNQAGKGVVSLVFPIEKGQREVELELPGRFAVTPQLRGAIRVVNGVREAEEV